MKKLKDFINEALRSEVRKWLENVYNGMKLLVKDNKVQQIDVDVKKLAKPEKGGFKFDDFATDKLVKEILNNKFVGFTVVNQMVKTPKTYLVDKNSEESKELKPECLPYWYQAENNVYFIGIIMFDTTISYIDEFANIVAIETSLCVKDSLPVLKAMLNDFCLHYLNKKGNYKGLVAKPQHPKMKSILTKLGFKSSNENKDILVYKI